LKFHAFQDFVLTAILGFFWLIATFGFSSGGSALEKTFDEGYLAATCKACVPKVSSFKDLTIALVNIASFNCIAILNDHLIVPFSR
jgi:hypothetical protein